MLLKGNFFPISFYLFIIDFIIYSKFIKEVKMLITWEIR